MPRVAAPDACRAAQGEAATRTTPAATRTALAGAGTVAVGVVLVAVSPWAALQAMGAATVGIGLYVVWVDLQARMLTLRPGQAGATGSLVDVISETGAALPLAIGHLADRAGLPAAMAAFTALALLLIATASRIRRFPPSTPE